MASSIADEVLPHHRARAEVQVAYLGVAHLPLRQADCAPAGVSVVWGKLAHSSSKTGVCASETALPGTGLREPPAVEHDQAGARHARVPGAGAAALIGRL